MGGSNESVNCTPWDNTMDSFRNLLIDIKKFTPKSAIQTQDVLDKRDRIKFHVSRLREYIEHGVILLEQFRTEEEYLHNCDSGGDRPLIIRRVEPERTKNVHGTRTTYCQKCNFQCHTDCPHHEDLEHCIAMDISHTPPRCKICPNKCPWNDHKSVNFSVQTTIKDMVADEEYISKRYAGPGEKLTKNELRMKLRNDFDGISCRIKGSISEICNALQALQDIALLAWPKSQVDYIDQIIQREEREMREGYRCRIQLLRQFREEATELGLIDSLKCDPFGLYRDNIDKAFDDGEDVTQPGVLRKISANIMAAFSKWKWAGITSIYMEKSTKRTVSWNRDLYNCSFHTINLPSMLILRPSGYSRYILHSCDLKPCVR